MIPRRLFTDGWELLFRSKTHFSHFSGKVHFPAPKRPMCSSPYVFPGQINDFGREKCTFPEKCTFLHFSTFGTKKSCESIDQTKDSGGTPKMGELFRKKCTFRALGAHRVPAGPGAGWLAGWLRQWARAKARGKEQGVRSRGRGARGEGQGGRREGQAARGEGQPYKPYKPSQPRL